jgi:hypothetical protein
MNAPQSVSVRIIYLTLGIGAMLAVVWDSCGEESAEVPRTPAFRTRSHWESLQD